MLMTFGAVIKNKNKTILKLFEAEVRAAGRQSVL